MAEREVHPQSEVVSPRREPTVEELAKQWREDFDYALEQVLERQPTREAILDVLWEEGFLNHLAPVNESVRAARKQLGRDVFASNDPSFYDRIRTMLDGAEYGTQKGFTLTSGWTQPIATVFVTIMERPQLRDLFSGNSHAIYRELFEEIRARAAECLKIHGLEPVPTIQVGTVGSFHGIPVRIQALTMTGTVWPAVDSGRSANGSADHARLYPYLGLDGVESREFLEHFTPVSPTA